ncbi:outer membrane efflux protein [Orenia metallireducens]|uniref:Outer membrane efflux protein n=1 Tax=Orenia metallireducens TaxID=1413210 RepID=A0A285IBH9_9FIRM|nr:TolC family protein [Orenia metallireducens]PRX20632.1 outer membrane efflux protein [Orenia metallireducens]SNY45283.1 Outer membrane efflux protein [Orenia metallireducens]
MRLFINKINILGMILILCLFISCPLFAKEIDKLTLAESIELALENNLDLEISKVNLDNSKLDYTKNKSNNLIVQSYYKKLENKFNLSKAKNDYRQNKNQLIIEVVNDYLKLLENKSDIIAKEKDVEFEKRVLDDMRLQVKRGYKGYLDLLKQQTEYNDAVFDLKKVKDEYQLLLQEFKEKLLLDDQKKIRLQQINVTDIYNITKKEALNIAFENSLSLKLKKEEIELAEKSLRKAKVAETAKLDLKKIKNSKYLTELNYKKEKRELETLIKKEYTLFQQTIETIELTKLYLKQIKQNYNIIKEQQQVGLKSPNELLSAEVKLLEAKYNNQAAITKYYLKLLNLKKDMGLEIGVSLDDIIHK